MGPQAGGGAAHSGRQWRKPLSRAVPVTGPGSARGTVTGRWATNKYKSSRFKLASGRRAAAAGSESESARWRRRGTGTPAPAAGAGGARGSESRHHDGMPQAGHGDHAMMPGPLSDWHDGMTPSRMIAAAAARRPAGAAAAESPPWHGHGRGGGLAAGSRDR
jgi:hypothetical protein